MEDNKLKVKTIVVNNKRYKPYVDEDGLNIPMIFDEDNEYHAFYLTIPRSLLIETICFEKL